MKGKRRFIIVLSCIIVIVFTMLLVAASRGIFVKVEYSSDYNKTFGEFTAKTTSKLFKGDKKNMCYSPVSLFATLTLVAESTEGDTQQEVLNVLGVSSIQELENNYGKMLDDIEKLIGNGEKASKINLCNSMWIKEEFLTNNSKNIIKDCEEKLDCEIFVSKSLVADEINDWVSERTNNLVKEIVSEDEVTDMKLALINTLYFKSSWLKNFSEIGKREFVLDNGQKENVEFIQCKEGNMRYKEAEDFTMVNVPMKDGEMIFVLPKEGEKLESLINERKLSQIVSLATSNELDEGMATVLLPIFEIEDEYEADLDKLLQDMGMKTIYSGESRWSISERINGLPFMTRQKTKITVDEKGVEAATATIAAAYLGKNTVKLILSLDRPFLYILMKDGVPLFIGTVYNPAE